MDVPAVAVKRKERALFILIWCKGGICCCVFCITNLCNSSKEYFKQIINKKKFKKLKKNEFVQKVFYLYLC